MKWQFGWGLWFCARGIGLVYAVAFLSLLVQVRGLIGDNGVLPVKNYLRAAARVYGRRKHFHVPTVFWSGCSDRALVAVCLTGLAASLCATAGWSQGPMFLVALICYLSLETVGQDFLSFQWDVLLIEAGYLVLFFAPFQFGGSFTEIPAPSIWVLILVWWLLFRLNFSSGWVKLASGDKTWRELTALQYHYETQPLPNGAAWHMHQFPHWFQKMSAVFMFVVELAAPFFIFVPHPFKLVAFAALVTLQFLILFTGNYGFFNWLTLVLCLPLLNDGVFQRVFHFQSGSPLSWEISPILFMLAVVIFSMSFIWFFRMIFPKRDVGRFFHSSFLGAVLPFKVVNTYGLFAVMTTSRPEIIIEGSRDGEIWQPYEFKWKPGRLDSPPKTAAPYQPRLDWQMWFAAMGSFEETPWLQNLCLRLLEGHGVVLNLLKTNPFSSEPPQYVRALLYEYHFTTRDEKAQSGAWWKSTELGEFSPVLSLRK